MKNVLVLCGDYYHSEEVLRSGFEYLKMEGVSYDFVVDTRNILSPSMVEMYDLIINCKGDTSTPYNKAPMFGEINCEFDVPDLNQYIVEGKSFLAIHAGISFNKEDTPDYTELVGCSFVGHPPRCTVEVCTLGNHPITEGVHNFVVQDEHYITEKIGEYDTVFLETKSDSAEMQIGGYTKTIGKGKVCCITPGHILDVWKHPEYQTLIKNAIQWCLV